MKKYLCFLTVLCSINNVQAQMNEMIGVLGVSGVINNNSINSLGQMQNALSRMQLQQDITLLVNEIQSTFIQDYLNIDVSLLNFNGLQGVKWEVVPVSAVEFYVSLDNIDGSACFIIQNNPWNANHIEINNGQDCQASNNSAKLYF